MKLLKLSNIIDSITLTNYETWYRHKFGCNLQPAKEHYQWLIVYSSILFNFMLLGIYLFIQLIW